MPPKRRVTKEHPPITERDHPTATVDIEYSNDDEEDGEDSSDCTWTEGMSSASSGSVSSNGDDSGDDASSVMSDSDVDEVNGQSKKKPQQRRLKCEDVGDASTLSVELGNPLTAAGTVLSKSRKMRFTTTQPGQYAPQLVHVSDVELMAIVASHEKFNKLMMTIEHHSRGDSGSSGAPTSAWMTVEDLIAVTLDLGRESNTQGTLRTVGKVNNKKKAAANNISGGDASMLDQLLKTDEIAGNDLEATTTAAQLVAQKRKAEKDGVATDSAATFALDAAKKYSQHMEDLAFASRVDQREWKQENTLRQREIEKQLSKQQSAGSGGNM